ncbi:MAG: D-alanyl-D-alanine carboxypeptidase [Desulfovibrionaceae bacterium]|nr:D-alanyl-D-alanine carboxypeptidase [Desulfovibrionaceae bacterium]
MHGAAHSALLLNASNGRILYSRNVDRKIPPASLTKVLSILVVMDAVHAGRVKLSDKVRISPRAARQSGSRLNLRAGERIALEDLLKGMAVASGNDAAMAAAEHVGRGSVSRFVFMMNAKARQIGMTRSHFMTPHGLPASGQVTTASDMAKLARYYLRNYPKAARYHAIPAITHRGRIKFNTNRLLGSFPGIDGLKTGWTSSSGYNIIATAVRSGRRLIAVVLGSQSSGMRSAETAKLLEAGFSGKFSAETKKKRNGRKLQRRS